MLIEKNCHKSPSLQPNETYINDYSPAITLSWRANTDVQYVWAACNDIVNYIAGYTTKTEKCVLDENKQVVM